MKHLVFNSKFKACLVVSEDDTVTPIAIRTQEEHEEDGYITPLADELEKAIACMNLCEEILKEQFPEESVKFATYFIASNSVTVQGEGDAVIETGNLQEYDQDRKAIIDAWGEVCFKYEAMKGGSDE